MNMKKKIPIGISDYRELKIDNYYSVDKSMIIKEFLDSSAKVTLITRPRRFGKTLNMSMMADFFDITKDSKDIFQDTAITKTEYLNKMNQFPIIFLSFSNAKGSRKNIVKCIKEQLLNAYRVYSRLLENPDMYDKPKFDLIIKGLSNINDGNLETVDSAIAYLMQKCYQYYNKRIMLFIDEYDTPFIEAHLNGCYEDLHYSLSGILSSALKDNNSLQYAMLTGIQRVAKENIFSGLNNLEVNTVMDEAYAQYFGFLKDEVKALLDYYCVAYSDEVRAMYDGYNIGGIDIYNPWSIINYVKQKKLIPYWVNVSSNAMIKKAMQSADQEFSHKYETLIKTKKLETVVDLETSFYEYSSNASLWGLFVNAGYLTIRSERGKLCTLEIPNNEVAEEFQRLTFAYLNKDQDTFTAMVEGIYNNEANLFLENYRNFLLTSLSYHDLISENSYHTLLLGMCASLYADYDVKSNQEAGKGRYDIILQCKTRKYSSYILELKYVKPYDYEKHPELLKEKCEEAIDQIKSNKYDISLQGKIIYIALAHSGKDVEMVWTDK